MKVMVGFIFSLALMAIAVVAHDKPDAIDWNICGNVIGMTLGCIIPWLLFGER